jgi:carboxypeptidase C (cathepsin A)
MTPLLSKLAVFGTVLAATVGALPSQDQVKKLDGWPDLRFGMYSGYVNITGTTKEVHYVATLAQTNWTSAPLIFWYNGGPGCSSMIGLM